MRHHTPSPHPPRLPRTRARLRRARRAAWRGLIRTCRAISTYWYSVVGLGLISAAAYQVSLAVGLLVSGTAVLIFEWRVREPGPDDAQPGSQRR